MSIRTVIEINHDYLDRLRDGGVIGDAFYRWISSQPWGGTNYEFEGLRILGERHHSETLTLKVK